LDLVILEVFSNLNDSMILFYDSMSHVYKPRDTQHCSPSLCMLLLVHCRAHCVPHSQPWVSPHLLDVQQNMVCVHFYPLDLVKPGV